MAKLLRPWLQPVILAEARNAVQYKAVSAGEIPPSTAAPFHVFPDSFDAFKDDGTAVVVALIRPQSENSCVQLLKIQHGQSGLVATISDGKSKIDTTFTENATSKLEAEAAARMTELEGALISLQVLYLTITYASKTKAELTIRIDQARFHKGSMRTSRIGFPRLLNDNSELSRILLKFSRLLSSSSGSVRPSSMIPPPASQQRPPMTAAQQGSPQPSLLRGAKQVITTRSSRASLPEVPLFSTQCTRPPARSELTARTVPENRPLPRSKLDLSELSPKLMTSVEERQSTAHNVTRTDIYEVAAPVTSSSVTNLSPAGNGPPGTAPLSGPTTRDQRKLDAGICSTLDGQTDAKLPLHSTSSDNPMAVESNLDGSFVRLQEKQSPVETVEDQASQNCSTQLASQVIQGPCLPDSGAVPVSAQHTKRQTPKNTKHAAALLKLLHPRAIAPPPRPEPVRNPEVIESQSGSPTESTKLTLSNEAGTKVVIDTDHARSNSESRWEPLQPLQPSEILVGLDAEVVAVSMNQQGVPTKDTGMPTQGASACRAGPPHGDAIARSGEEEDVAEPRVTSLNDMKSDPPKNQERSSAQHLGEANVAVATAASFSQHACIVQGWPRAPDPKYVKYARRRIPKDQQRVLAKETTWLPSNIGAPFNPSNVPLGVIDMLRQQSLVPNRPQKQPPPLDDLPLPPSTMLPKNTGPSFDEQEDDEDSDTPISWTQSSPVRRLELPSSAPPMSSNTREALCRDSGSPPPHEQSHRVDLPYESLSSSESDDEASQHSRDADHLHVQDDEIPSVPADEPQNNDSYIDLTELLAQPASRQIEVQESPLKGDASSHPVSSNEQIQQTQYITISSGTCPDTDPDPNKTSAQREANGLESILRGSGAQIKCSVHVVRPEAHHEVAAMMPGECESERTQYLEVGERALEEDAGNHERRMSAPRVHKRKRGPIFGDDEIAVEDEAEVHRRQRRAKMQEIRNR